jgi:uracil-DNA glycosylase
MREITFKPDFESWRAVARQLLKEGVLPSEVQLLDCEQDSTLWTADFVTGNGGPDPRILVPHQFLEIAKHVACHINPLRWQLLYSVLWRLRQNRDLLKSESDDQVKTILFMDQQVRRDVERMHTGIKFDRIRVEPGHERLIAWHRPDYATLELATSFFAERFARVRWSILTPFRSAHWEPEGKKLDYGAGVPRFIMPSKEELKQLWLAQRSAPAQPARKQPVRADSAQHQLQPMFAGTYPVQKTANAKPFVPTSLELPVLNDAVERCQGCELHRYATQAVFGVGPADARIMLVGEQPGNDEDIAGKPFVGPAGKLLDRAFIEAGIERDAIYISNAVKHFKFERRGIKRIHRTPQMTEIKACRPWLEAEIRAIKPEIIVCLGATAAKSILNLQNLLMKHRGQIFSSPYAEKVIATIHPSAILRAQDPLTSEQLFQTLCRDLKLARETLENTNAVTRVAS